MSQPLSPQMPIFLIGFMGAGKTTVGKLLAQRLSRSFIDLDDLIVEAAGLTVAEIFANEGEGRFRQRETEALKKAAKKDRSVVATGGGSVCSVENLNLMLTTGRVVTLVVSAGEALKRTGSRSGRPLLDGSSDPLTAAKKLLETRGRFYDQAPLRVETDGRTPEMVVSTILSDWGISA
jgi:shikimate kinase